MGENGHGDGMLNENFVMKLRQIFPSLETIGSVKQLQISMTSELSAEPKMTREKKMKIFKVGLEIVKDQFPMDAELILIDKKSGCTLKKEKLREAVIEENFRN